MQKHLTSGQIIAWLIKGKIWKNLSTQTFYKHTHTGNTDTTNIKTKTNRTDFILKRGLCVNVMSQCQFRGNKSREGLCLGQMMRWRSATDEWRTPAEQGVPDLWTYRHIPHPSVWGWWTRSAEGKKGKGGLWSSPGTEMRARLITQVPVYPAANGGFSNRGASFFTSPHF